MRRDSVAWAVGVAGGLAAVLAVAPGLLDRWTLPKLAVLGVALVATALARPRGRVPRGLGVLLAATAAVLVVAALAAPDPAAALLGVWPRFEGLVAGLAILGAFLCGVRLLGPGASSRERHRATLLTAGAAGALGVVTALEEFGLRPIPSDLDRPGALLGNATDQGAVAAALAVVLLAGGLAADGSAWRHRVPLAGAVVAAATVVASGSRAALVALVAGVVLVLVVAARRGVAARSAAPARGDRPRSGVLVAVALGVVAVAVVGVALGRWTGFADAVADRLVIATETLRVVTAHPLLGVGPSGFADAVAREHDAAWFARNADAVVLDSPHQVALQVLVAGGPIALVLLVGALAAAVAAVVRRIRRADGPGAALSVVGWAAGAGVILAVLATTVTSTGPTLLGAFLAGAATARPAAVEATLAAAPGHARRVVRAAVALVLAAWLALVGVATAAEARLGAGTGALARGDVATAIADWEAAAALRPWDPLVPVIAAESLVARLDGGDLTVASAALDWSARALDAAPRSRSAVRAAVTARILTGDLAGAAAVLEVELERRPLDPWIAHRAGAVAWVLGAHARAEELLLAAVRLDPGRADPWVTLAALYRARGDDGAARDAEERAADLADAAGGEE